MMKSNYLNNNIKFNYFVLLLLVFSSLVIYDDKLNSISLYAIIPLLFIYAVIKSNSISNSKYLLLLTIIYTIAFFLWPEAEYKEAANRELKRIFGSFLFCYTIISLAVSRKNIYWLYVVYLFVLASSLYYAYNTGIIKVNIYENERFNDEKLNANTLAYFTFFCTFASFMLFNFSQKKGIKSLFLLLFIGIIILTIVLSLLTASRQVLLIEVPFVIVIIYIKMRGFFKKNRVIKLSLLILVGCFLYIFGYNKFFSYYDNSFLQQRSQKNIYDDDRTYLLNKAMQIGISHPITGVGPGQFKYYSGEMIFSHCTYTELFANYGIVPMMLYVYLFFIGIKNSINRYIKSRGDPVYLYFLTFFVFCAIDNFFYVYYLDLWLMGFLFLVIGHSETYFFEKNILQLEKVDVNVKKHH
jgi:O-antigen ligase